MNVLGILKDALKYPLTDWKKILILGIIIIFSGISGTALLIGSKYLIDYDIMLLAGIGFIIGFLVNGYMFRIISTSLNGKNELPEFKNWVNMGFNGIKVLITFIVYIFIPVLVILSLFSLSYDELFFFSTLSNFAESIGLTFFDNLVYYLTPIIEPNFFNLVMDLYFLYFFVGGFIALIYTIIVTPIFLVAIANMAYYKGELKSAFRIREIVEEISIIGWINLIKWFILTGIVFLGIEVILLLFSYISFTIHLNTVVDTILWKLLALTLIPFLYIFIARSVALFYMPDEEE